MEFHWPDEVLRLRDEAAEVAAAAVAGRPAKEDSWINGHDPQFARELGERGWLGMTWPKRYGGHERSMLERLAVTEELLAASAPVAAHWIGDRQSGPLLLRYGSEAQRAEFLPRLARGEIFFSIVQRKVVKPQDFGDLHVLSQRLLAFQDRYNATAGPFDWRFTRKSLDRHLAKIAAHEHRAA